VAVTRGFLAVLAADHTVAQLDLDNSLAAPAVASAILEESVAAAVVVAAELVRPVLTRLAVSARNTPFQALPPTMRVAATGREELRSCSVVAEGRV
jgi:hypothetical protein